MRTSRKPLYIYLSIVSAGSFLLPTALSTRPVGPGAPVSDISSGCEAGIPYYCALDFAFRRPSRTASEARLVAYEVVLRFVPARAKEWQAVITAGSDGQFEVTRYRLSDQSDPVWKVEDEMFRRTGRDDAEEIARQVRVTIQKLNVKRATLDNLVRGLSQLRFSPELETATVTVSVDGESYELWLHERNGAELRYFTPDPGEDKQLKAYPIVQWMRLVERTAGDAR